ncbi:hypothetical protein EJ110_NYTH22797 [Nymphaea thermarum]|nr:hypothetical protein EJ110_NYTH22797 [Nymphaea thermarum]
MKSLRVSFPLKFKNISYLITPREEEEDDGTRELEEVAIAEPLVVRSLRCLWRRCWKTRGLKSADVEDGTELFQAEVEKGEASPTMEIKPTGTTLLLGSHGRKRKEGWCHPLDEDFKRKKRAVPVVMAIATDMVAGRICPGESKTVLLDIALLLGKILPCSLANSIGEWANHMCRTTNLANPKASQSLSAIAIYLSSSPNDLAIACNMASELLKVIGTEEEEPIKESKVYLTINNLTGNAVATLILHSVEYFLVDLEWAILKWKTVSRDSSLHLEAAFCARAEAVVSLASQFAEMNLKGYGT